MRAGLSLPEARALSAFGRRKAQRVAYGAPDMLGVFARVERLVHGAVAQAGEHLVAGPRVGVGGPEVVLHSSPELGQPHGRERNPRSSGRFRTGRTRSAPVRGLRPKYRATRPSGCDACRWAAPR